MPEPFDQLSDQVDKLLDGEMPPQTADLDPLVRLAARLPEALGAEPPDPAFRARLKAELLERFSNNVVPFPGHAAASPGHWSRARRAIAAIVLAGAASVALAFGIGDLRQHTTGHATVAAVTRPSATASAIPTATRMPSPTTITRAGVMRPTGTALLSGSPGSNITLPPPATTKTIPATFRPAKPSRTPVPAATHRIRHAHILVTQPSATVLVANVTKPSPTQTPTITVPPTAIPPTATIPAATATRVPPTSTNMPATNTPRPTATAIPSPTRVLATATSVPSATALPPTATPRPSATLAQPTASPTPRINQAAATVPSPTATATRVPPTATNVPATNTPRPTATATPSAVQPTAIQATATPTSSPTATAHPSATRSVPAADTPIAALPTATPGGTTAPPANTEVAQAQITATSVFVHPAVQAQGSPTATPLVPGHDLFPVPALAASGSPISGTVPFTPGALLHLANPGPANLGSLAVYVPATDQQSPTDLLNGFGMNVVRVQDQSTATKAVVLVRLDDLTYRAAVEVSSAGYTLRLSLLNPVQPATASTAAVDPVSTGLTFLSSHGLAYAQLETTQAVGGGDHLVTFGEDAPYHIVGARARLTISRTGEIRAADIRWVDTSRAALAPSLSAADALNLVAAGQGVVHSSGPLPTAADTVDTPTILYVPVNATNGTYYEPVYQFSGRTFGGTSFQIYVPALDPSYMAG